MKDFEDEIPGYLNNDRIRLLLEDLPIKGGVANIADNMACCYAALVDRGLVGAQEIPLLQAWFNDIDNVRK
jgi:hypothetical protein